MASGFLLLFAATAAALCRLDWRVVAALTGASVAAALATGAVSPVALPALACGVALLVGGLVPRLPLTVRRLCSVGLVIFALATGFHLLPGFERLPLVEGFGRDGARSLSWIYDKGFAGLLLVWLHQWQVAPVLVPVWRRLLLLVGGVTAIALLGWLIGLASPDPRLLHGIGLWILGNVFLTVAAEEALFRGMIQRGLQQLVWRRLAAPYALALAATLTALLFAAVHLPWGVAFAVLAAGAGLFYGYMYGRRRSLGWAIAGHAGLNAAIAVGFASPLA